MCVAALGAMGAAGGGLGSALSMIGQVFGIFSGMQQMQMAKQQQAMAMYQMQVEQNQAKYQAAVAQQNQQLKLVEASHELAKGRENERLLAMQLAREEGDQVNKSLATGFAMEGTPAGLLESTNILNQQKMDAQRYNTSMAVYDKQLAAHNEAHQSALHTIASGQKAKTNADGTLDLGNTGSTLLGGATPVASKWYSYA